MTVIDATQDAIREDRRAQVRRSCESVFREHNEALIRFAFSRVKSWEVARELVQVAYQKIFEQQSPPAFTFLRSYIYKAVGTLCLDALKKRKIHAGRDTQIFDAFYATEVATPEREALMLQARELLNAALVNLPPRERMAFTLVEMQGHTVAEAAQAMRANEVAVYSCIRRAYAGLARTVSPLGGDRSQVARRSDVARRSRVRISAATPKGY